MIFLSKRFDDLYNVVFDSDGKVKSCGRECCKELISECSKYTSCYCGDISTGFMNIDVIKSVYSEVKDNI